MGLIDYQTLLATNQAVTATAGTTDLVDFGVANAAKGNGEELFMRFTVTTSATNTGSVKFEVQDCDTEGGSYVAKATSADFDADVVLLDGFVYRLALPEGLRRFVKGGFVVTGTVAALTVTVDIVAN
jgi:hypothetical protein